MTKSATDRALGAVAGLASLAFFCSLAMADGAATTPRTPPALRVSFEADTVKLRISRYCYTGPAVERGFCQHEDPAPGAKPGSPTLTVRRGGGVFINTTVAADSVRVIIGPRTLISYRASSTRWAVALPAALPRRYVAHIEADYATGIKAEWTMVFRAPRRT